MEGLLTQLPLARSAQSLGLVTLADPTRVALMGHSAGTNGVLSLGGGGLDNVATSAGTDVEQGDRFVAAFAAIGPNASSSDDACDRPQAFLAAGCGWRELRPT